MPQYNFIVRQTFTAEVLATVSADSDDAARSEIENDLNKYLPSMPPDIKKVLGEPLIEVLYHSDTE